MISEELLQSFIAEASDLLDDAETSLVDYSRHEDEEERTEIVNRVFRHFHSIKGSAGFVGLHNIALLTHEAETLLEQYRKAPEKVIPQQDITLLCQTIDLLRAVFAAGGETPELDSESEGDDLGLEGTIAEIKEATKKAKASSTPSLSTLAEQIGSTPTDEEGNNDDADNAEAQSEVDLLGETQSVDQESVEAALAENSSTAGEATDEVKDDGAKPEEKTAATEQPPASSAQPDSGKTTPKPEVPAAKKDEQPQGGKTAGASFKGTAVHPNRGSSETARLIKGSQMAKRDKLHASDFAMRYATEANELLEQIEQSLLQAEQHPESSADAVQEALRCLHSFKGNSGFMNLGDLERLSHRMESEVENHIDRTLGLDTQTFDALLQMIDVLRQGVHDFSIGGSGRIPEADAYIEMMDEFSRDRFGTLYRRSATKTLPETSTDTLPEPKTPPKDEEVDKDKKSEPATPKKDSPKEQKDTRQLAKESRPASDTTRMVLVGTPSTQINLSEAPKAGSIVITTEAEEEEKAKAKEKEKAFWKERVSEGDGEEPRPAKSSDTSRKTKEKRLTDTTQKRRNADQLASRNDIRVDLRKLDSMLDLVGELVIAEAMVTRHPVVWNAENESLERAVHQLRRVASSLQDMATSVRMIPLAPTFRRMTRLVYDLSVKAGKQVDLVLLGEDTEVDRTVIERISDPLVHIIRNAIDHGIESPEERVRLGKPETGRLTIEGHHEGGEVWIIVTDDGRGLNREAILDRAISRGLIQGDGSDLTDREIYHYIFEPGFSTATRVTDISGRGFGMDVVKKNVEKLSGRIDIQSRPGEGTAVVMRIPLTLAIIVGMLVSSGGNRYIIPLLSIRESLRPEPEQIITTPDGQQVLKLRGELIPIVKLDEAFSRITSSKPLLDGILMIVEGEDGDVVALFADELIGQQETVIKGLSGWLKKSRGVSGCTILGDGEVGLILDIGAIVRIAREHSG